MKRMNFLCLLVLGLCFAACHSNDDTWGDWSRSYSFVGWKRTSAVAFKLGENVYVGLGSNKEMEKEEDRFMRDFWKFDGHAWTRVDSFPGLGRDGAVAFVVKKGGKELAYVGTGFREVGGNKQYFKDFYTFDGTNWEKANMAAFPGEPRRFGVAFSLNNKGYVGTGMADGSQPLGDMWCYDPDNNTWTDTKLNTTASYGASVFVIESQKKAVLCLGTDGSQYTREVRIFDGQNWTAAAPLVDKDGQGWDNDYNRIPRAYAVAFTSSLDGGVEKGYIATGEGSYRQTCWEYDIIKDRWDEVTELPNAMAPRSHAVGFSLNDYGYVVTGGSNFTTPGDIYCWTFTPGIDEDDDNDYGI